ncbi:SusC/RagA family TonB-linked outer membrane protein [Petrimonas sulfuriphila]|uniref:SusC/RagA family TonB-linked outer membrane protein n=1 Tax=Petrimonas sulfuriphila TaxID=285070 RepID=UPI0032536353
MRITLSFLFFCILFSSASNSYSQEFTIKSKTASIKEVCKEIEKGSGYVFVFSDNCEKLIDKKVNVEANSKDVMEVLDAVLSSTGLTYKILDKQIVVYKSTETTPSVAVEQPNMNIIQQPAKKQITGKIVDVQGEAIIGANIIEKGSIDNGTVTDIDGNFSISVLPNSILEISYIGYISQEVYTREGQKLNIILEEDLKSLDEIVVIGYGSVRRKDLTGAVSRVDLEDNPVSLTPNTNVIQALRATTPGLNIGTVNTSGGSPSMLIRGQNSLSASNNPLIVVDGVVFLGNINDINPADIASVDVLKDASSAAVYGSRAANGVISFTTKRGKTDKPTLSFTSTAGMLIWNTKPKMMSLEDQLERIKYNTGVQDPLDWMYQNEAYNYEHGIVTNWPDYFSRTGYVTDNQLNISGGTEKINYYLSAGYTDQEGVIVGDDYDRISVKGKINTDITSWLEIGLDGSFNRSDYSGIGASINTYMMGDSYFSPYRGYPEDNIKKYEKWPRTESRPGHVSDNPLWLTQDEVADDVDITDAYRLATFANIEFPFIKGLSYRINYVTNLRQIKQERFIYEDHFIAGGPMWDLNRYSPSTIQGYLPLANGTITHRNIYNYVFDNIINYKRTFDKHALDVTLVATRDHQGDRGFTMKGNDFEAIGNTLLGIDGIALATNQTISNSFTENFNIGYLARLNYVFNNRYHFTSSFRRDGSSVFGADNKWGNFPSVGVAWTISEENFMKSIKPIDYLKIRMSYGKNGNQGISAYETLARVNSGSAANLRYQWGDQPGTSHYGMTISSLGNSTLGWETTTSLNWGLEAVLLDQRVFLDIDYYTSKTYDQLFTRQIPAMSGFTSIRASMGQVDNRGIEIGLRTINIENKDFTWSSNLTFWQNRNILADLYGDGKDDIANNLFIDKSLGAIYGYEFVGIVQKDDTEYIANTGSRPGDVKWKDLNNDGKITAADDRKILGYIKENFRLNLSNTLNYKNFELYIHLSGIFGGGKDNYFLAANPTAFLSGDEQAQLYHPLAKISYWTPDNPSNKYPSPHYVSNMFQGYQSRTFVRVQDITLSHDFNANWLNKIKISSLRLYLTAQHLYTFTGWDGDPESGIGAISSNYPVPASLSAGLNIKF